MLIDMDIEVREGWELIDFREDDESVTAVFNGGREVKGSFLIGCDGIKSATRSVLIKLNGKAEGLTTYTGMTQVSAFLIIDSRSRTDGAYRLLAFPRPLRAFKKSLP